MVWRVEGRILIDINDYGNTMTISPCNNNGQPFACPLGFAYNMLFSLLCRFVCFVESLYHFLCDVACWIGVEDVVALLA